MAKVLVLRCSDKDGKSSRNFQWPGVGEYAEAPDWSPEPVCGQGLHGWLWGAGDVSSSSYHQQADALWQVVEVEESDGLVDLGSKVKFRRGLVILAGKREEAVALVQERAPTGTAVIYGTARAEDHGTASAGSYGTASAGPYGTASAGDGGTASAGDGGTASVGYRGTIQIRYWDAQKGKYRWAFGEVGEGIDADTEYVVRDGQLVKKV